MSKKSGLKNATKLKKLKSLANQVRNGGDNMIYASVPVDRKNKFARTADALQENVHVASFMKPKKKKKKK
jgi:hypothetical protein